MSRRQVAMHQELDSEVLEAEAAHETDTEEREPEEADLPGSTVPFLKEAPRR